LTSYLNWKIADMLGLILWVQVGGDLMRRVLFYLAVQILFVLGIRLGQHESRYTGQYWIRFWVGVLESDLLEVQL
jgi:hypothetical protein